MGLEGRAVCSSYIEETCNHIKTPHCQSDWNGQAFSTYVRRKDHSSHILSTKGMAMSPGFTGRGKHPNIVHIRSSSPRKRHHNDLWGVVKRFTWHIKSDSVTIWCTGWGKQIHIVHVRSSSLRKWRHNDLWGVVNKQSWWIHQSESMTSLEEKSSKYHSECHKHTRLSDKD